VPKVRQGNSLFAATYGPKLKYTFALKTATIAGNMEVVTSNLGVYFERHESFSFHQEN